ncbi:MAG: ESX secretion-associated protein EspG [Nocardia sp.]|nr:ESX secretion-associated protein EspG [Nocardia sp.]
MPEWYWEGDDFAALWYSDANDRIPNILRYTSKFTYQGDFERHRADVLCRYDTDEFERIQHALNTLTHSDMRIEIPGGTSKYKGSRGVDRIHRIIGARTDHYGAILYQRTQGDTDGLIRLRLCRADHLATRVVEALPNRPPGKRPTLTVHPQDLQHIRRSPTGTTPAERYQKLIAELDGGAGAQLLVGAFNSEPAPTNRVQWYDVTDDGRYLETRGEHITVRPVSAKDLAARFDGWIERELERRREDEYAPW